MFLRFSRFTFVKSQIRVFFLLGISIVKDIKIKGNSSNFVSTSRLILLPFVSLVDFELLE